MLHPWRKTSGIGDHFIADWEKRGGTFDDRRRRPKRRIAPATDTQGQELRGMAKTNEGSLSRGKNTVSDQSLKPKLYVSS